MRTRILLAGALLAAALPVSLGLAGRRGDQRFLHRILAVDGPRSGIDTIHGLTPDTKAKVTADVMRQLEAITVSRGALVSSSCMPARPRCAASPPDPDRLTPPPPP